MCKQIHIHAYCTYTYVHTDGQVHRFYLLSPLGAENDGVKPSTCVFWGDICCKRLPEWPQRLFHHLPNQLVNFSHICPANFAVTRSSMVMDGWIAGLNWDQVTMTLCIHYSGVGWVEQD